MWGVILALLLLVAGNVRSVAQTVPVPPPRGEYDVGIGLRLGGATHSLSANVEVPTMNGADSGRCGFFDEGSGDDVNIGVIGSLRLTRWLAVDAGIVASFVDGRLAFPCVERADIRLPDGSLTAAETEFVRTSKGRMFEAEFGVRAMPVRSVPIWVGVLGRIAVQENDEAEYTEEVVTPQGAIFPGIGEVRPIASARDDVPTSSFTFGPNLSADIRVGERARLRPLIGYLFDLNNLDASPSLRRNRFITALSLEFLFSTGNPHSTPLEPQGN